MAKQNTTFRVDTKEELMNFLMKKMPENSRSSIKSLLSNNKILVNDKLTTKYNFSLNVGDVVIITKQKNYTNDLVGIKIIYEDDDIVVIDKENGILTMATEREKEKTAYSLLRNYIKTKNKKEKIFIVHRLDRDTSGLLIFAKTEKAQDILQTNWNNLVKERKYTALVQGNVQKDSDTIVSYLAENKAYITYSTKDSNLGKKAVSHYKKIKSNKNYSLLEVKIETGRKNQIRVHMQDLGHSVVGDKKYGATKNPINRLGLHATTIVFRHPITNKVMSFTSTPPQSFYSIFK